MFGRNYVIEHCVNEFNKKQTEKSYQIYVTDALQAIAENTTHLVGIDGVVDYGKALTIRWIEAIESKPQQGVEEIEDNRSCDEIVNDMWERMTRKRGETE